jgi:hypothetical protein
MSGLFSLAQTAIGCGIGLLLADKLRQRKQSTAITLFSVAIASAVPVIATYVASRVNAPESNRGMRNRLRSIREDGGWDQGADFV